MTMKTKHLNALIKRGYLSPEQVQEARRRQKNGLSGHSLEFILLELGHISLAQLNEVTKDDSDPHLAVVKAVRDVLNKSDELEVKLSELVSSLN